MTVFNYCIHLKPDFQVYANAIDVVTGDTYSMDLYLKAQSLNFDHDIWASYQMPPLTVSALYKLYILYIIIICVVTFVVIFAVAVYQPQL